jgi:hypothetical protein
MADDAVIANPTHSQTQAVTVEAPPDDIWPWLVQMGYQRGRLYSYDWLDRLFGFLDRPTMNRIHPEFQHLAVRQPTSDYSKPARATARDVRRVVPAGVSIRSIGTLSDGE